jgi:hypothetical protein
LIWENGGMHGETACIGGINVAGHERVPVRAPDSPQELAR